MLARRVGEGGRPRKRKTELVARTSCCSETGPLHTLGHPGVVHERHFGHEERAAPERDPDSERSSAGRATHTRAVVRRTASRGRTLQLTQ